MTVTIHHGSSSSNTGNGRRRTQSEGSGGAGHHQGSSAVHRPTPPPRPLRSILTNASHQEPPCFSLWPSPSSSSSTRPTGTRPRPPDPTGRGQGTGGGQGRDGGQREHQEGAGLIDGDDVKEDSDSDSDPRSNKPSSHPGTLSRPTDKDKDDDEEDEDRSTSRRTTSAPTLLKRSKSMYSATSSDSTAAMFDLHYSHRPPSLLGGNESLPSTPPDLSDPLLAPLISLLPKHIDPHVILSRLLMKEGGRGWIHPTAFGDFKTKESWRKERYGGGGGGGGTRSGTTPAGQANDDDDEGELQDELEDDDERYCSVHRSPSPASSVTSLADLYDSGFDGEEGRQQQYGLLANKAGTSIYLSAPEDQQQQQTTTMADRPWSGEEARSGRGRLTTANMAAVAAASTASHPIPTASSSPSTTPDPSSSYSPAYPSPSSSPSPSTSPYPHLLPQLQKNANSTTLSTIRPTTQPPLSPSTTTSIRRQPSSSSLSSSCTCTSQLSTLTRDSSTSTASRTSSIRFAPLPEEELREEKRKRAARKKKNRVHDANSGLEQVEKKWAMGIAGRRELLLGSAAGTSSPSGGKVEPGHGSSSERSSASTAGGDEANLGAPWLGNAAAGRTTVPPRLDNGEIDLDELDLDFGDSDNDEDDGDGSTSDSSEGDGRKRRTARRKGLAEMTLRVNERGELVEKRPLGVTLEEVRGVE